MQNHDAKSGNRVMREVLKNSFDYFLKLLTIQTGAIDGIIAPPHATPCVPGMSLKMHHYSFADYFLRWLKLNLCKLLMVWQVSVFHKSSERSPESGTNFRIIKGTKKEKNILQHVLLQSKYWRGAGQRLETINFWLCGHKLAWLVSCIWFLMLSYTNFSRNNEA